MKALRYIILLSLHLLYSFAFSQKTHIDFKHIGTNDGLSHSNVLCILQDRQGFMWFGTRDGLNKYDGYKFTVFKNKPCVANSISHNYVQAVMQSKNGYLWIATLGGGLNRYDCRKNKFIAYRHDKKNNNSIASDFINTVMEDSQGNILIGTSDEGLDMFDPQQNQFTHHTYNRNDRTSLSDVFVRDILEDSRGNLWITTINGGLNLFNKKNNTFTRFQHNEKDNKSISSNNIYTMFEDSKHRLWIGTNERGIDLMNRESREFTHFKHDENNVNSLTNNFVYAINEDDKNNLWIGTENGGLSIFDPSTGSFQTYQNNEFEASSLGNNSIYSIYRDTKGDMWLGTFNAGVDVVTNDKNGFVHYKHQPLKNSLSHNKVLCIYEASDKNIWIGTDGGGVNLFDPITENFTHYRHKAKNKNSICGDYVLGICEDDKGNFWIGTWADGITIFNKNGNTFRHFKNDPADASSLSSNNAWAIFKDDENKIWIGTYGGGMDLFDPVNNSFKHFKNDPNIHSGISSNQINFIKEYEPGKLWIGTNGGGLNLFDKKTEVFTHFLIKDNKNSMTDIDVTGICEDSYKNLWISTSAGLYFRDNKTKKFTTYTTIDGLPNNMIFGILEDDKRNLWISTNKGISRFNPVTKQFKNFSVADGLQGDEFKEEAYCKSSSGAMYFGGNNGFNQFFPDSIKPIPFEPPLVITNFQVFNKEVDIATGADDNSPLKKNISETKEITLPYKSSVFSFEFASLNYTSSEKKQYAYMLEGFDKSWNEIGTKRTATYTNLDPGNYTFKVKGLNNEGDWSSHITNIKLIITPPFWLTWWFKILAGFAVVGGSIGFYQYRVKAINKQKTKLQQQVREQTLQLLKSSEEEYRARWEAEQANIELELKNKELEQFAYVASHDLQEPLRTTSSFVELLQKQYKGKFDEKADKYFTFILEASERMKELIKNLLDYSRIGNKKELEKVDCNGILNNVLADLSVAISEAGAVITCSQLPVINGYATELKQLFQNLITNAIKFRKKDTCPQINISVQKNTNYWQFTFKDNGIGIEEKHNEKIFVIFQRLHTRNEYEGTGIGLSYCKKIVELHHGKIWIESKPGIGSTFNFTIRENTNNSINRKVMEAVGFNSI